MCNLYSITKGQQAMMGRSPRPLRHHRRTTGICAEWTADADDSVGYCCPDFVDLVIHCYRFCFGLAAGDPALAKLENRLAAKPKIVVPAVTLDGVDDPLKPGGRHVAPFPSDLVTGDYGLMSGLRPICRDCLHCEGGRRCSWHLSFGSVRHPSVHRLGGPGPCHRDRRRWLKTTRAAFTWPQSPSEFIWTCCLAPGKRDPHREAPTSPQSPTQWHLESRRREGALLTTSAKQLSV
jgi:hypothetical protein